MRNRLPSPRHLVGFALVVGSNLVPLAGIAFWNWELDVLLTLYWLEILTTTLFAGSKALFAERASADATGRVQPLSELTDKRGGLRVRADWPPLYVRNVPFALGTVGIIGAVSLGYGLFLALHLAVSLETVRSTGVFLSIGALVASHAVSFHTEYIGRREYEHVSARMIAATPARQTVLLVLLAPFVPADGTAGGAVLLVFVVAAKLLSESYSYLVEHVGYAPGRIFERLFETADTSNPPPRVDAPDVTPDVRIRTSTRAVLLSSFAPIVAGLASRPAYIAGVLFVLGLVALGPVVIAVTLAVLAVITAAKLTAHYVRFGVLEYQLRGDHIVAYDTLFDEPQWQTTVDEIDDASVVNAIPDRLFGTGRFSLTGLDSGGRSAVTLGPVSDPHRVADEFSLPIDDVCRPEPDHVVLAAAFVLAVCFLAVPVGLYLLPTVDTASAVIVTILLGPFFLFIVGLLVVSGLSRV
ncbi:hypothetical protein C440_10033 [Haloferax mucosum ATCC BAA-1512]|uniref:Uncharacterized protein n=1 Tax=Haloferax mucosum ATCC BAA-1512 TaxID=662479 RepID=M0IGF8_9EURY|nr:DUF6498-containing protein [Haloferax mucosum]ELZ94509.1 hypothetical protein C440_10033 [Haloferax mucosum ATCC BAA-1512]